MKSETVFKGYFKLDQVDLGLGNGNRLVLRASNSVAALFYVPSEGKVLLVRQSREAMATTENQTGEITELVAGRFDANFGVKELVIKEALEEAGAKISENNIRVLNGGFSMALSAGSSDERSFVAYVEIEPEMIEDKERIFGNPKEGERIKRIWMKVEEFRTYICEDVRVFALREWFFRNIIDDGRR